MSKSTFGWVCHIESDRRFGFDRYRLVILKRNYDRSSDVLMSDGTWENVPEMQVFPETENRTVGIVFPADTINAFVDAVREFKGDKLDSATEVKLLREWLTVEQSRVSSTMKDLMDITRRKLLE